MPGEEINDSLEAGPPLDQPDQPTLEILRHSAAHLLAAAVTLLYPGSRYDVGPAIEDGFFYNFGMPNGMTLGPDELVAIEKKMTDLVAQKIPFEREILPKETARAMFSDMGQDLKVAIIDRMPDEIGEVGIYRTGQFVDLCRGPHVPHTGWIKAFRIMRSAGVYWRGREENEQLQRVYGTAWFKQGDLDGYLHRLEEAERRDHRRLGKELGLFHIDPTAPGMPYWLPDGFIILSELIDFSRQELRLRGYQEISTPLINESALWKTSGHWDHYQDGMFLIEGENGQSYGAKPMNCPNAMVVFNLRTRSYRDLPLRFSDTGILHRNERSGTLHGLLRVQKFQQDDAHIFISEDQIPKEYERVLEIVERFYGVFGLTYQLRLGTRPEKFMGDPETWEEAEKILKDILLRQVGESRFTLAPGDGAFYGPKIDIIVDDAIGRSWQLGTIQLDFQIPRRFGCTYVGPDGAQHTPVVIHRAIYGSLERFIGILIEHFAGQFPLWLAPVQCEFIPVQDDSPEVDKAVREAMRLMQDAGIRVFLAQAEGERMQARIRASEIRKVPYIVVMGKRDIERADGVVTVRDTRTDSQISLPLTELASRLATEIRERRLPGT